MNKLDEGLGNTSNPLFTRNTTQNILMLLLHNFTFFEKKLNT
jgi:hypothetical protein